MRMCDFIVDGDAQVCTACGTRRRAGVRWARCESIELASADRRSGQKSCVHLGAEIGRRPCEACAGRVQIKEFQCLHPSHVRTTISECGVCADYAPATLPKAGRRSLLLRFWHGLGDHIQFGVVLKHIQVLHPDWSVDLACHGDKADGLLQAGLCRAIVPPDHVGEYDQVRSMYFWEADACYGDSPSTKAEKCLREIFQIQPRRELSDYLCEPTASQTENAREFARRFAPFVLAHATGHSARTQKDLPLDAVAAAAREAKRLGRAFVLMDLDNRGGWEPAAPIYPLRHGEPTLGRPMSAGVLAALARQADLCIGIDSGPGKVFAASGTTSIIVWSGMHPLHYHGLAENVTHLVRADHARNLRGDATAGLGYFVANYHHRVMQRNVADELTSLLDERLAGAPKC